LPDGAIVGERVLGLALVVFEHLFWTKGVFPEPQLFVAEGGQFLVNTFCS
jgi:hypothetical protein